MESISNSIQFVKEALLPLELGIKKTAKDVECCFGVSNNIGDNVELIAQSNVSDRNGKVQIFGMKKRNGSFGSGVNDGQCRVGSEERKKALPMKVPVKAFIGMFSPVNDKNNEKVEVVRKGLKEKDADRDEGSCMNCFQFAITWSVLVNSFVQAIPNSFNSGRKRIRRMSDKDKGRRHSCTHDMKSKASVECRHSEARTHFSEKNEGLEHNDGKHEPFECFIGLILDQLTQNLQKFDHLLQESKHMHHNWPQTPSPPPRFEYFKSVTSIWEGKKVDVNGFLGNLKFARVGGVPSGMVGVASQVNEEGDDGVSTGSRVETAVNSPQNLASGILSIPLSNVERLKSTLSTVSLTELIDLVPLLGRSSQDHPDKKKLFSVQDFFRYTESEGRRFFEELDRDGDGQVTLDDLEFAMRKRNCHRDMLGNSCVALESHFSKSFNWKQFLSLMEQKEPTILRAYTSLCLSKSGTLQKSEILASLKNAGLPANEDNAVAMMRFLNADTEESISYGHFRNFMLLLPSDRLLQDDPRNIWFEAATVVAVAPPVEIHTGSVLKSALAGGLACALSTSLLHPTRVQASTMTFPEIISKLPQIGVQGLYRGSIPAILGQFSSHGLRTGIFEASKIVLINVAPNLPEIQILACLVCASECALALALFICMQKELVQSMASFCSTLLGTAVRIPCEVLKQRLQAGLFDNVGEALVGTWNQDGLKGFFRGTGATLCREVPFYVAGMGLYAESKKLAQQVLRRELEPWETIAVGALSGGLAAVVTTPFDVMKLE
ncbi:Chaperone DnaJ-domain superfamily protein isoform 1 [Hibiscus syriacus]|uniref:Chaperone DnaJ-domain superfamily protein isoform 1 n=1 Tax=Hibiscus syriacus TaxID=106335 RepID=A0A6A2YJN1_HIBSY|nr:Chaperone DnaJ-domain superfamily protein isoform 1 [Hibiscus syriacus]